MIDHALPQGFEIVTEIFTRSEVDRLSALASGASNVKAGMRHLLQDPLVRDCAHDPRLGSIAAKILGSPTIPFKATLFSKSSDTNWRVSWHQDRALPLRQRVDLDGWGPWSMKEGVWYANAPASALKHVVALRLHLDDSTSSNGPLCVLPGTHKHGVLTQDRIIQFVDSIAPIECVASAGSVVAMRPLLLHSSSKCQSNQPRRVLHIEYAPRLDLVPSIELAIA